MENQNQKIPPIVRLAIRILSKWCKLHPTCKGCGFRKDKIGCYFRYHSPREWKL